MKKRKQTKVKVMWDLRNKITKEKCRKKRHRRKIVLPTPFPPVHSNYFSAYKQIGNSLIYPLLSRFILIISQCVSRPDICAAGETKLAKENAAYCRGQGQVTRWGHSCIRVCFLTLLLLSYGRGRSHLRADFSWFLFAICFWNATVGYLGGRLGGGGVVWKRMQGGL